MKVVPTCNFVFDFDRRAAPILVHLDKSHEKIQNTVTQLLHISMLVGRSLVAVNSNALMHDLALEILFFSERFHHQLLQIFRKQCQPFFSAYLSRSLPTPVTATACLLNCSPFSLNFTSASSIPFRVSFVPPDFETTTTSVWPSSSLIFSKTRSNPSGSVLSKNKMSIGSCRDPSASETNCGPSAEPPMPMSNTCLKGFLFSAVIFPPRISAANVLIRLTVSSISVRISRVGAKVGFRSQ